MDQNQNMPPSQPMNMGGMGSVPAHHDRKVGPIVATLIIVLVLIVAALYLFATKTTQSEPAAVQVPVSKAVDNNASASDASINTATDLNTAGTDLDGITNGIDNQNF